MTEISEPQMPPRGNTNAPRPSLFSFALWRSWLPLLAALAALWLPLIQLLGAQWSLYEQYHYGWVVPLLCIFLAYRRGVSLNTSADSSIPALAPPGFSPAQFVGLCFLGLSLLPLRIFQEANPLWRLVSYALTAVVIVSTLWLIRQAGGRAAFRHFLFPICFFLIAVPWPTPVEAVVIHGLTRLNTNIVVELMAALGVPAVPHGNIIETANGMLGVDEACSGIRSTQAVLMLSLFFGEFFRLPTARRLSLIGSAILAGMFFNIIRTSILVALAVKGGLALSEKWHDTAGVCVLVGCFIFVWWLSQNQNQRVAVRLNSQKFHEAAPSPKFNVPVASCCAVIFLGVLAIIGSELWFRWHEREQHASTEITVHLPTDKPMFRTNELSARVRSEMLFDSGLSAMWKNADGTRWQFFHFRWNPAHSIRDRVRVHMAKGHRPEICLPSAGRTLEEEYAAVPVTLDGAIFSFRAYRFSEAGRPLFIFFCVRDDATAEGTAANMRESHRSRWQAAWNGNRGVGQRVVEIAIWGSPDLASAENSLRRELPSILRVRRP